MPITYNRDDELSLVTLTVTGGVSIDEWEAAMARQIRDRCWRWATLYNGADRTRPQTAAELSEILRRLERLISEHGPRGPVAYVAQQVTDYGRSREYSALIQRLGFEYATFTDPGEALQWLVRHQVQDELA